MSERRITVCVGYVVESTDADRPDPLLQFDAQGEPYIPVWKSLDVARAWAREWGGVVRAWQLSPVSDPIPPA